MDFEVQTDHSILTRKKTNLLPSGFYYFREARKVNEKKQKDKHIPESCLRAEEAVEHEGAGDINCSWYPRNLRKR